MDAAVTTPFLRRVPSKLPAGGVATSVPGEGELEASGGRSGYNKEKRGGRSGYNSVPADEGTVKASGGRSGHN